DVLVAGENESRGVDLAEPVRRGRLEAQHPDVVVALLLPENLFLHLADQIAHTEIHVVETAPGPGKPHAQIRVDCGIQVAAFQCLLLRIEERHHVLRPFVIREPGADEHESRDPFRLLQSELERRVAPERYAYQRGPVNAFGVHYVAYRAPERNGIRLERRVAETGYVDAQHGVRLRERAQLRFPESRIGEACVQEHDGRAFT